MGESAPRTTTFDAVELTVQQGRRIGRPVMAGPLEVAPRGAVTQRTIALRGHEMGRKDQNKMENHAEWFEVDSECGWG